MSANVPKQYLLVGMEFWKRTCEESVVISTRFDPDVLSTEWNPRHLNLMSQFTLLSSALRKSNKSLADANWIQDCRDCNCTKQSICK